MSSWVNSNWRSARRSFRRRRPEHRRLDLDEPLALHGPAQRTVHLRTQPQIVLHAVGPEVQVPIAQPYRLVGLRARVEGERRRLGGREDLDFAFAELDFTSRQRRVRRALGAGPHGAGHAEHLL